MFITTKYSSDAPERDKGAVDGVKPGDGADSVENRPGVPADGWMADKCEPMEERGNENRDAAETVGAGNGANGARSSVSVRDVAAGRSLQMPTIDSAWP